MNRQPLYKFQAFSLIELLVVIAVVALLISVLLPALHKARIEAWKTVSMANVRSIVQAGAVYQNDFKGDLPLAPIDSRSSTTITHPKSWSTWSAWGTYCDKEWQGRSGSRFDLAPNDRPLNPYLNPDPLPGRPSSSQPRGKTPPMKWCKDPSDTLGHQQNWGNSATATTQLNPWRADAPVNKSPAISCYDDVGTSYLWQGEWFAQALMASGNDWGDELLETFSFGQSSFRSEVTPERFVWITDESANVVLRHGTDKLRYRNGFGDINKGVVGYLDTHVRYVPVTPGGRVHRNINRPWLVPAFNNEYFTTVFPTMKYPKTQ